MLHTTACSTASSRLDSLRRLTGTCSTVLALSFIISSIEVEGEKYLAPPLSLVRNRLKTTNRRNKCFFTLCLVELGLSEVCTSRPASPLHLEENQRGNCN